MIEERRCCGEEAGPAFIPQYLQNMHFRFATPVKERARTNHPSIISSRNEGPPIVITTSSDPDVGETTNQDISSIRPDRDLSSVLLKGTLLD